MQSVRTWAVRSKNFRERHHGSRLVRLGNENLSSDGFVGTHAAMVGLDRTHREVRVATVLDESGVQIAVERFYRCSSRMITIGSLTRDFGDWVVR